MRQRRRVPRVSLRQRAPRWRHQRIRRRERLQKRENHRPPPNRHRRQDRAARRREIRATNIAQPGREIQLLPIPEELVQPGMMQVEEGIAGGGNRVSHEAADTAVAADVGGELDTGPELEVGGESEAFVDVGVAGLRRDSVVDETVDAVRGGGAVAGAEAIDVAGEGAIDDAAGRADAVTSKAGDRIKNNRGSEMASVAGLIPVSVGVSRRLGGGSGRNIRLCTLVAALLSQDVLVGVHVQTMVRQEGADTVADGCWDLVNRLQLLKPVLRGG